MAHTCLSYWNFSYVCNECKYEEWLASESNKTKTEEMD